MTAHILVVDDDPHMGELLVAVLDDLGHAVDHVATGAEAWTGSRRTCPTCCSSTSGCPATSTAWR